ncbi:MAG TPA: dTDP-4-dehydrorhamnose reductase [Chitinophagaceae bacterium]
MNPLIAVSGRNGQLGWEIERLSVSYPQYRFVFCDREALDITDDEQIETFFETHQPAAFINCAAYTAVDKAETEQVTAYRANAVAVGALASQCQRYGAAFISFSTDYVFSGEGSEPYREDEETAPVNYYGFTKALGEQLALKSCDRALIIRTSWVYSAHGHNFVNTMLRLMKERQEIGVVNDQLGSPTYARDLAEAVMEIVARLLSSPGYMAPNRIYHFSNEGTISWFDFAVQIKTIAGLACEVKPIPSSAYPTPAKRPAYSVLKKERITADFGIRLKDWKTRLAECINEIKQKSGS